MALQDRLVTNHKGPPALDDWLPWPDRLRCIDKAQDFPRGSTFKAGEGRGADMQRTHKLHVARSIRVWTNTYFSRIASSSLFHVL